MQRVTLFIPTDEANESSIPCAPGGDRIEQSRTVTELRVARIPSRVALRIATRSMRTFFACSTRIPTSPPTTATSRICTPPALM